jgi:peptide-methionine (S)-S-oxide reductase
MIHPARAFLGLLVVLMLATAGAAYGQSGKAAKTRPGGTAIATFAGGCFWCMEPPYDKLPGVLSTTSGYMGGKTLNPTYEQVTTGTTGHAEVVQVEYDPRQVSFEKLLEVFWRNVDPTQADGQFCDIGSHYRTAIFYHTEDQRKLAENSKAALQKNKPFKGNIVTEVAVAGPFYRAEEYHQDFYKKNPRRYQLYRTGCGRDARLQALWGRPGD